MMTKTELTAAIKLLDDPDKEVYKIVEQKILDEGPQIIPDLVAAFSAVGSNSLIQRRLKTLIPALEYQDLKNYLINWRSKPNDIFEVFWMFSKLKFPFLSQEEYEMKFSEIYSQLPKYSELSNYTPWEKIKIFNYYFYGSLRFSPTLDEKCFDPDYCFLPNVLQTRFGNPMSMAVVYMLCSQSCGFPMMGINLPKNFLLAFIDTNFQIAFYINPFNKGISFSKNEIEVFIRQQKLKTDKQFFVPCTAQTTVLRYLNYLRFTFKASQEDSQVDKITSLINLFDNQLDDKIEWE